LKIPQRTVGLIANGKHQSRGLRLEHDGLQGADGGGRKLRSRILGIDSARDVNGGSSQDLPGAIVLKSRTVKLGDELAGCIRLVVEGAPVDLVSDRCRLGSENEAGGEDSPPGFAPMRQRKPRAGGAGWGWILKTACGTTFRLSESLYGWGIGQA
jgi:hypothetical protein